MDKPKTKKRNKDPSQGGKRAPESALSAGSDDQTPATTSGLRGISVLKEAIQTLGSGPGVYRMLDAKGEVLYVGKARNLKRRVTTYSQPQRLPIRLQRMVQQTAKLEVVATASEVEALLLESNMIKRHMPRFNVLLRDDKSFPYILLTRDEGVPRIAKHRGQQTVEGDYFGPFASAGAVDRTITALEKAFLLRSCSDAIFKSRQRPCLLYQIKRCAGPCVGMLDASAYAGLVAQARAFLKEGDNTIQRQLAAAMEEAAKRQDYEAAATYRDRIKALTHIQSSQSINVEGVSDADVLAAAEDGGQICVQVFFFRAGRNYGNRAYFPQHDKDMDIAQVLAAFTLQFYDSKPAPRLVLLSHPLPQQSLIAQALSQRSNIKVELLCPQRGARRQLVESAALNAREALSRRLAEKGSQQRLLEQLADRLGLEAPPKRIEIYDNSHLQGDNAYGAMVVAGPDGFQKNAYRQFLIKQEGAAGDDYAMMREVLLRRFQRAMKEDPDRQAGQWPDLVLLDGGKGQLSAALEVMNELGLSDIALAAVAKGPERDAGRERIFLPDKASYMLEPRDPVLYFIQRLRDEAHRFAIGTHRRGRAKSRLTSILDEVTGIGAKRKRALLLHFGSAASVSRAGLADLMAVPGISEAVARKIFQHFHTR